MINVKFIDYCKSITDENEPLVIDNPDEQIDEYIKAKMDNLLKCIKNKIPRIATVELPFIEQTLSDPDNINKLADQNIVISDGIASYIVKMIYNKPIESLSTDEESIIKVILAYLYVL